MEKATSVLHFENDTVRVTKWELPPQSETGHHLHQFEYVVVPLDSGELRAVSATGETATLNFVEGHARHSDAGVQHNVRNLTGSAVRFVEVEMLRSRIPSNQE